MRSILNRAACILILIPVVASVSPDVMANCTAANPNGALVESTPTSALVDNGDETITHTLTGLMWKRCEQGLSGSGCTSGSASSSAWKGALASAVSDTTGGFTDWRVPNRKELESIIEYCGHAPAINTAMFPATPYTKSYWTSSSLTSPTVAWAVSFDSGAALQVAKAGNTLYTRLVRGGNASAAFDAAFPGQLDIDGNGKADALTDGLLVLRYLFGLHGPALIQNAIGPGAQRTSAADIESYLQSIKPK